MKQYKFNKKNENRKLPALYKNIFITVIIFSTITTVCRFNPNLKESVKNILYTSYDIEFIKDNSEIYLNKCKEFITEIKSNLIQEE